MAPGPDVSVKITEAYAAHVARDAYFWAWPLSMSTTGAFRHPGSRAHEIRPGDRGTGQSQCHAHRLYRSSRAPGRLPEPGRGLRPCHARARPVAGGGPGSGLRRSLLGLSDRRCQDRQLRPARQDVWHDAWLLSPGGAELEGRGAEGHHQGVPLDDQHRLCGAAHLPGRHAGGQTGDPGRPAIGDVLSARRV